MSDTRTDLLVIGAGPYAYAAAAYASDRGIDTHVVGIPMSFWRDRMPQDMYLRSGTDWYLDANREHTFEGVLRSMHHRGGHRTDLQCWSLLPGELPGELREP